MKKKLNTLLLSLTLIIFPMIFIGCSTEKEQSSDQSLWNKAVYNEDQEFGEGALTIKAEVIAEEKSVTFTIHTDSETLGDALVENELVSGEEGEYGLYIKSVNGIEADFDVDGYYWSLTKDGEYLTQGADSTVISDGEHYELTRVKG